MDMPSVLHDMRNYMDSNEATNPQPRKYSSSKGFSAIVETASEEDHEEPDEDSAAKNTSGRKGNQFSVKEGEQHLSKSRVECRRRSGG